METVILHSKADWTNYSGYLFISPYLFNKSAFFGFLLSIELTTKPPENG